MVLFATYQALHIFILLHTNTKPPKQTKNIPSSHIHVIIHWRRVPHLLFQEKILLKWKSSRPRTPIQKQDKNPTNTKLHYRTLTIGNWQII